MGTSCSGLSSTDRRGQGQDPRATDGASVCPHSLFPKPPNPPELEQHVEVRHAAPLLQLRVSSLLQSRSCVHRPARGNHTEMWLPGSTEQLSHRGRLEVWPGGEVRLHDPLPPAVRPPALPPAFFQLGGGRRPAPTLEPGPDHPQQCPSLPVYHMSELSGLVTSHPQLGGAEGPADCERCPSIRCELWSCHLLAG